MAQNDILNLLRRKKGKWLCNQDFVVNLNLPKRTISKNVFAIKKRPEMFNVQVSVRGKKNKIYLKFL